MKYIKLIALHIDDFSSSIFFEDNFGLDELDKANEQKLELESKGYICILTEVDSGLKI